MKTSRARSVRSNQKQVAASRPGLTIGKLMVYAPMALQAIGLLRRSQKAKRGKYVKARKRDRALDFMLGQAERRLGGRARRRR